MAVFLPRRILLLFMTLCLAECINIHTVHSFPNGTWVENIAVRKNGNLLVTLVNTPELWEVNPFPSSCTSNAALVYSFAGAQMANGITEMSDDKFAVIASNAIWTVDFNASNGSEPVVSKLVDLPAGTLNGMTTLDAERGTVLISDSEWGLVWLFNTETLGYSVVLSDSTMTARPGRRTPIGINGIKYVENNVYYNNCPGELYCRVMIDALSGTATGPYETIATGVLADDIAVTKDGVGYLAGLDDNTVTRVFLNGTRELLAGNLNSTTLVGPTAAAFGRTRRDRHILYITTSGGEAAPVNTTYTEGGKVLALDLQSH